MLDLILVCRAHAQLHYLGAYRVDPGGPAHRGPVDHGSIRRVAIRVAMMALLAWKVALVTGAARGLGLETTRLLLKHGAKVTTSCVVADNHSVSQRSDQVGVLDFSRAQLDSTCRELEQHYGEGKVLRLLCDVTDNDKLVHILLRLTDDVAKFRMLSSSWLCVSR